MKSGFADKPVTYVSFYDSLRFANWLNNGQGSGEHGDGRVHAARRDGDAEQRADRHAQRRREHLPHQRERVVQGGVLQRSGRLLRLPDGDEQRDGLRRAGLGHGQLGELLPGRVAVRIAHERWCLRSLGQPLRHVRPGRERVGVERADRGRLGPGRPGRELEQRRQRPRRVGPEHRRCRRARTATSVFVSRVSSPSPERDCS